MVPISQWPQELSNASIRRPDLEAAMVSSLDLSKLLKGHINSLPIREALGKVLSHMIAHERDSIRRNAYIARVKRAVSEHGFSWTGSKITLQTQSAS